MSFRGRSVIWKFSDLHCIGIMKFLRFSLWIIDSEFWFYAPHLVRFAERRQWLAQDIPLGAISQEAIQGREGHRHHKSQPWSPSRKPQQDLPDNKGTATKKAAKIEIPIKRPIQNIEKSLNAVHSQSNRNHRQLKYKNNAL